MAKYRVETDKGVYEVETNGQLTQQQPQQGMEQQNIMGQVFNVPGAAIRSAIQGKGYTQGAVNPSSVPKFQDMAIQAVQKSQSPVINALVGMPASAVGMAADMVTDPLTLLTFLVGGIGSQTKVAKTIGEAEITLKNDKLAGNVINSLIKPAHKEYMFGKNPGQAIAKEGIIAGNLEDLGTKVSQRIEGIKQAISTIRSTPENIYKSVDLTDIKKPLIDSLNQLKKTPLTNSSEISSIQNAQSDIANLIQNVDKVGLNKLTVSDAYQIKDAVSTMQKWDSPGTGELNKALKQVYHAIDNKIDVTIPELKDLNSRMSNLISANKAIFRRSEALSKQEPMPTVMKLLDLPFAAAKTPTAKTIFGKLLAKQFKLP